MTFKFFPDQVTHVTGMMPGCYLQVALGKSIVMLDFMYLFDTQLAVGIIYYEYLINFCLLIKYYAFSQSSVIILKPVDVFLPAIDVMEIGLGRISANHHKFQAFSKWACQGLARFESCHAENSSLSLSNSVRPIINQPKDSNFSET